MCVGRQPCLQVEQRRLRALCVCLRVHSSLSVKAPTLVPSTNKATTVNPNKAE